MNNKASFNTVFTLYHTKLSKKKKKKKKKKFFLNIPPPTKHMLFGNI